MPSYARCPDCHAAVPQSADWCSLCHADLRPPPPSVEHFVAAGVVAAQDAPAGTGGRRHAAPDGEPAPLPPVRGRHRRPEPDEAESDLVPVAAADATDLRADVDTLVSEVRRDADGKPDVEALSEHLMARLASSESRRGAGLPDLDSVPGGKWGVMIGGMVGLAVLLVVVFSVLGSVVLH